MYTAESTLFFRAWRALLALIAATLLAAACGGGSNVDTGGTGALPESYSSGRITGYGSVIVNGVRFDDSKALVLDDDGMPQTSNALQLGMVVDVTAGGVTPDSAGGTPHATATMIQLHTEIVGPVVSVDVAGNSLVVLGQTVDVDTATVFSGSTGLAGLAANDVVEVFGFYNATSGHVLAARIEKTTGATSYQLRGAVANLDTNAKTFQIGGAVIDYSQIASGQLPTLSNGQRVRAVLNTTPHVGVWVATKISSGARHVPEHVNGDVEGFITNFTSAGSFSVDGVAVDASGSGVQFANGTAADLANGVRVEVEGTMTNGVLVATKVEFNGKGDHGGHGGHDLEVELHGAVQPGVTASTFLLRNVTVHFDNTTQFAGGTAADLVTGAQLEVKGTLIAGTSDVQAVTITFGH